MTNKNRRGVNQHDKKQKDEIQKQFQKENRYEFSIISFSLLIAITLFLISLYNDTTFFSLLLAVYALIVTISFETSEWVKYGAATPGRKQFKFIKFMLKYYSFVLLGASAIFFLFMFILHFFTPAILKNVPSQIPNILTIGSLIGYFCSYSLRNYFQKRQAFIKKYELYK